MQLIFFIEFRNLNKPDDYVQYNKNGIEIE